MDIGFIIERNVYFKTFGPIIDKALEFGHQVFCFHDYSQPKTGSKGYQFPSIKQTPTFKNGKVVSLSFCNEQDFCDKVLQNKIQIVVSLDFIANHIPIRNKLKEKGVFWVSLQSGFDSLVAHPELLKYPDRFFIFSRDGFWAADKSNIPDKNEIKKEWGLPEDKKVVLLFPFPFGSSLKTFWTKYIFGWHNRFLQTIVALLSGNKRFLQQAMRKENDFEVMKAIRKFCDNNNGFLIIKSRQKDPVKKYAAKMADKILYDEEFYPSTAMKCFAVADIFFSFYSTGVMEAVSVGVSSVCISPDENDWIDLQNPCFQAISEEKKLFHWPGVSYKQTVLEIIKNLPEKKISDFAFDKSEQAKYLRKFVDGKIDGVAESIVLEIEKMLEK